MKAGPTSEVNLELNPMKLSGQAGKHKTPNYEADRLNLHLHF